jgi:hypothetical protein
LIAAETNLFELLIITPTGHSKRRLPMIHLPFKRAFLPVFAGAMLTIPMAAVDANAKIKEAKFHFVQHELSNVPTMAMEYKNGKWKWIDQSKVFHQQVKFKFKSTVNRVSGANLRINPVGSNHWTNVWGLPANYKTYKYESLESFVVGKNLLSPNQNSAASLCDVFGGSKKVIRDMNLPAVWAVRAKKSAGVDKRSNLVVKVVCMPKKASRPSSGPKVAQINFYTIPARPQCNKPVSVVADFVTTAGGKLEFSLVRNDGANQKQSAIMQNRPGKPMATGRWLKTYTLKKTTSRRYQIVMAKQAMASKWIDVKVNCGIGQTGGKKIK